MKTSTVLLVAALCATAAVVVADFDELLGAMVVAGMLNNGMGSCVAYGKNCQSNGNYQMRCCQYVGYSRMACRNGMCLQESSTELDKIQQVTMKTAVLCMLVALASMAPMVLGDGEDMLGALLLAGALSQNQVVTVWYTG
ncbi:hypothetical protein BaRGS_00030586 [Batillaria attramentaria]|uniref:Uncharacterized protein n=1 Tax=Batillaria attramentaria TaxID=370345 RepID=A0ABD0JTW7_9CAEN